jgi:uncharacterized membrane protein YgdD (TMEM256/DUF423 family)
MRLDRIHLVIGCLFGAAGVALQAAGSHLASPQAATAGQFLLVHAPVLLAGAALRRHGLLREPAAGVVLSVLAFGVALFAADLARRGLAGASLFPFAAPIGGNLMLAGWLALALAVAAAAAPRG